MHKLFAAAALLATFAGAMPAFADQARAPEGSTATRIVEATTRAGTGIVGADHGGTEPGYVRGGGVASGPAPLDGRTMLGRMDHAEVLRNES